MSWLFILLRWLFALLRKLRILNAWLLLKPLAAVMRHCVDCLCSTIRGLLCCCVSTRSSDIDKTFLFCLLPAPKAAAGATEQRLLLHYFTITCCALYAACSICSMLMLQHAVCAVRVAFAATLNFSCDYEIFISWSSYESTQHRFEAYWFSVTQTQSEGNKYVKKSLIIFAIDLNECF